MSLRSASDAGGLGNAVGTIAVPLDTGERDAHRRLEAIVAATRQAKRQQHPAQIGAAMAYLAATPLAQRFITRQHLVNVFISNLAGPTVPLYFLGARIHDAMPIVNPVGNVAVAFCGFSYDGVLYLVTTVDASTCPDVDVLIVGMRRTWEELGEPAPATTAARGTPAGMRAPRSHRPRRHRRGAVEDGAAQLSSARPRVTQVRSSSDP